MSSLEVTRGDKKWAPRRSSCRPRRDHFYITIRKHSAQSCLQTKYNSVSTGFFITYMIIMNLIEGVCWVKTEEI
jgi:hypothetical protein